MKQDHRTDQDPRAGVVYWVTGLAGAGKTTLGRRLAQRLRRRGRNVVFLDGDELRARVFPEAGYAPAERLALATQYSRLCGLLARQGTDVVCATISMFPEIWERNRRDFVAYREILVRAPEEVLLRRRQSLYGAPGEREHVVGRSTPVPEPPAPHVVLENDGRRAPAEVVDELVLRLGATANRPRAGAVERSASPRRRGTKAEILERLEPLVRTARVLPQLRFTVADWHTDPGRVLERLAERGWLARPVLVRSSALGEDVPGDSLAGRFLSLTAREGTSSVRSAIEGVVESLDGGDPRDQVFVQPWLKDVRMSGVVLTRDPGTGSHRAIVEYDAISGRTDTVTSGSAGDRRTYSFHRGAQEPPDPSLTQVLALARELEELPVAADCRALDIEFAETRDGVLWLLQVRPLALPSEADDDPGPEVRALERIRDRIEALGQPHPYLYGTRAVFGTMPDWNPAEVIGVRPKPLALSLYRELVTDSIWAYQRSNYGYRNLRSFPLLVSLGGLPYVDVRVSFNSFLPADLGPDLGRRLVDEYVRRLQESPLHHDKVEFAIVYSGYTLDLFERMRELGERGFDREDRERLGSSLLALTNRITAGSDALFRVDLAKIDELVRRQRAMARGGLGPVARAYWLLEDCKRFGTLPFAGIARAAFIARQMLDSLVAVDVLDAGERERFLRSLHTVRGAMNADLGRLGRADFLREYGHLRPGTYDVTSMRYDEAPEAYFDWEAPPTGKACAPPELELSLPRCRRLDALLAEHGLAHDHASLFAFLRDAIEGREYAKFVFSRSLSEALVALVEVAEEHGFSREELAFADAEIVRRLYAESEDPRTVLGESIAAGRRRFAVTRRLDLPPLLSAPSDAFAFHVPASEPSYVTTGTAFGPVVRPEEGRHACLPGSIVMIQSADPGHDWIFSHEVAGFITMYGGYNSHMAIRAGELGIPAVIGAGPALYRDWAAAGLLRVDCLNRKVDVLG